MKLESVKRQPHDPEVVIAEAHLIFTWEEQDMDEDDDHDDTHTLVQVRVLKNLDTGEHHIQEWAGWEGWTPWYGYGRRDNETHAAHDARIIAAILDAPYPPNP